MVTHGGTLHGWLRIGGSGELLFVAYTLCRVSGFDDDEPELKDIQLMLVVITTTDDRLIRKERKSSKGRRW